MRRKAVACSLIAAVGVAGCGGGGKPERAARAADSHPGCQASVRAALADVVKAPVRSQLVASDPQTATCAYRAGAERVKVEVDSVAQAYMLWETVTVHQVQANVGRSQQAKADEYPKDVQGVGVEASWIPSERQLVATNATRTRGGAFVRVTVKQRAPGAPSDRTVAKRVARAALSTAPRGPA